MAIRVLIVENNHVYRMGLRSSIQSEPNIEIAGELENMEGLIDVLQIKLPDILLLDVDVCGSAGIKTIQKAATFNKESGAKVIAISSRNADAYMARVIHDGATGFLCKNTNPDKIVKAIDAVYHNGFYFDEKINLALINRIKKKRHESYFQESNISFTRTEFEVLRLLCQEMTSTQISEKLFISSRTVEDARCQLLKKIGAKNSVGLALWAVRNDLISE